LGLNKELPMKFPILFFLTLFSMTTQGQNSSMALKEGELSLHYVVREPIVKSAKMPVLILLHGLRSDEEDLFSLSDKLPANMLIISARAPFELEKGAFGWYEISVVNNKRIANALQVEKSRILISSFIDELLKKYAIDPNEVYLMGFSQGAIMSYSVALYEPEKVKAIVALSGRVLEETKTKIAKAVDLKKLSIFIEHGTHDQVIQVAEGRAAVEFCKSLSNVVMAKEYPMGHEINYTELGDINTWLKEMMK
jgi:phospholipase/carboxylesterase